MEIKFKIIGAFLLLSITLSSLALSEQQAFPQLNLQDSQCLIAEAELSNNPQFKSNPEELPSFTNCTYAASSGLSFAQTQLGNWYYSGILVNRDVEQAYFWLSQTTDQNRATQYKLGLLASEANQHGFSLEALNWFEKSAFQGFTEAYFPTASLFFNAPLNTKNNLPSEQNLAKTFFWLSATIRASNNQQEVIQAERMLKKVKEIMPSLWKIKLNTQLNLHFSQLEHKESQ